MHILARVLRHGKAALLIFITKSVRSDLIAIAPRRQRGDLVVAVLVRRHFCRRTTTRRFQLDLRMRHRAEVYTFGVLTIHPAMHAAIRRMQQRRAQNQEQSQERFHGVLSGTRRTPSTPTASVASVVFSSTM